MTSSLSFTSLNRKWWQLLAVFTMIGMLPFSGSVKTKVIKIIPPGGSNHQTVVMSPLPKGFPVMNLDLLHIDKSVFQNLSQPLPPAVSHQLTQEMSLKLNSHKPPKPFQTKELKATLQSEHTLQQLIAQQQLPPLIPATAEPTNLRTNLELRSLRRKKNGSSTLENIPEMIREILYYIYCDRKLTLRQFKEQDRVLYKSLMSWSLKNQAKLWPAVKEVAEEWLHRPPNSPSSNHQYWNRVPLGFPPYFQKESTLTVFEESFKLHPSPEEDLESYLFQPHSLKVSSFVKERLPPILRTSSILCWHLSKRDYQRRLETSSTATTTTTATTSTQTTGASSSSPLSYQYGSFFSSPSPSSRRDEYSTDSNNYNSREGSTKKWMIDGEEMFIPNQLSETDDYFTVL